MSTREIASINSILKQLVSQLEEKGNLWHEYFSKYLDDKFLDKIRIFNKNRNIIQTDIIICKIFLDKQMKNYLQFRENLI